MSVTLFGLIYRQLNLNVGMKIKRALFGSQVQRGFSSCTPSATGRQSEKE
jgi:hypothetical protein